MAVVDLADRVKDHLASLAVPGCDWADPAATNFEKTRLIHADFVRQGIREVARRSSPEVVDLAIQAEDHLALLTVPGLPQQQPQLQQLDILEVFRLEPQQPNHHGLVSHQIQAVVDLSNLEEVVPAIQVVGRPAGLADRFLLNMLAPQNCSDWLRKSTRLEEQLASLEI